MRLRGCFFVLQSAAAVGVLSFAGWCGETPVSVSRVADGVLVTTAHDQVHIAVCGSSTIHVTAAPDAPRASSPQQPWIVGPCAGGAFSLTPTEKFYLLSTDELQVKISIPIGGLQFADKAGNTLLTEGIWSWTSTRQYQSVEQPGGRFYNLSESFQMPEDEAIYGLGQHQTGSLNNRGLAISLAQNNTDVAVPLMISTRGYGLLWNTAARSMMNNQFPRSLRFSAEGVEGLDYYFLYGPEADQIIHLCRELTGHAPLFGEWAYGLFQSKDRYETQDELVGIVSKYRSEHMPLDTVVQDWQWWTKWGSSDFNDKYPDFAGAVSKIHDQHAHVMISIWPNFDPSTAIWKEMNGRHFLIDEKGDYDVTNREARELYWKMLPSTLVAKGVDAFWLDASEPEAGDLGIPPGRKLNFGASSLYTNIFPFMHSLGVYEHWRHTSEQKRNFVLTRSAFLGQQRNAAATWSGDVYSNFWALRHQVPAGLNFSISGIPYWTTDIGGYGFPNGDTSDPKYQEVFTRWFEYGAFCPIFRIHGHRANNQNELWAYGPATPTLVRVDRLRYRLLPYIYSLAWQVTKDDYTIMRPLAMDWRGDRKVWEINDQFMFGPALLVNPVTGAGENSRTVYLPAATGWYDFWTGERVSGEQTLDAAAPLDRIPLYVRAGSIVPMGPEREYASEKPDAPIELRIYRGADGSFVLYQDQGDSYAYEHGAYAIIPIRWEESSSTLTIGARQGSFPGMAGKQKFEVVWVDAKHGGGAEVSKSIDKEVAYSGSEVRVTF
jgi:alpha-D-xyloside xylohydrolase